MHNQLALQKSTKGTNTMKYNEEHMTVSKFHILNNIGNNFTIFFK